MNIEYDGVADAAFIWFLENIEKQKSGFSKEIWPKELNDEIGLLFDSSGKLMGLELLNASKFLDAKHLKTKQEPG